MQIQNLDPWQKEVLETDGDICLVSGRQVGKSEIWSVDASEWAVKQPKGSKDVVLMISKTERQAHGLFQRTLEYLYTNYKNMVVRGKDRPTKKKLKLTNGITILCLPAGLDGAGIRFLTVKRLYGDEAHYIPEDVWTAVTPMLVMTGGCMRLSSTPRGDEGFFYECCKDTDNFKVFHKNTEEVVRERKLSNVWTIEQKEKALAHLAREQKRMTKLQYAQEYMGEFVHDLKQFFSDKLIKSCLKPKEEIFISSHDRNYLGIDVARFGKDKTVFVTMSLRNKDSLRMIDCEIGEHMRTTEVSGRAVMLNKFYGYDKIFVDDGGVGAGVFDELLMDRSTRSKVVGINNARKAIDNDGKKKKILKENLYMNLKNLMEKGKLQMLDDPEIFQSFKGIQGECTDDGNLKLHGIEDHIVEACTRAAWCVKAKGLKLFVDFF